jgi:hypothetical protein
MSTRTAKHVAAKTTKAEVVTATGTATATATSSVDRSDHRARLGSDAIIGTTTTING